MRRPRTGVVPWSLALLPLLCSCVGYEPAPVDPSGLLGELERLQLADQAPAASVATIGSARVTFDPADGVSPVEAAAISVHLNPALRALRAEVGVARAELVQAGLLPDPVIGWEAMNNVADFITDRKSSANSYIAGLNLSWDVPRPGEIDAKEGVARARIAEVRAALIRGEWALVRDVYLGFARLAAAQAALALNAEQDVVTTSSLDFFQRARAAGAATAIEERLAAVLRDQVRSDRMRLELEEAQARQGLLALMGLPPQQPLLLQDPLGLLDPPLPGAMDPVQLARDAIDRRPDLRQLMAQYQQAEHQLRLEVRRQFPQISIGSGIAIQLPIFSEFNGPAIDTARLARSAAAERVRAVVHEVRRDVHLSYASLVRAEAQVAFNQNQLGPTLEELLRLTRAAVAAGEVTPLEILTAQNQRITIQLDILGARLRRAELWIELLSASGQLLPTHPRDDQDEEEDPSDDDQEDEK